MGHASTRTPERTISAPTIPNFLLDNPELAPVAMVLIAVVCVGVGYLLMRASRYGQRILWALAGLSLLPVVALTLVPTYLVRNSESWFCVVQFSMPTLRAVELLLNVALFFPPVFFATLATRRPLLILAAGTALSATIEVIQGLIPEIGRACDTNDWAMNTAGTVVAVLLASATIAITRRSRPVEASDPA